MCVPHFGGQVASFGMFDYVVQDTEFPGVVVHPVGGNFSTNTVHWKTIQCNVNMYASRNRAFFVLLMPRKNLRALVAG